jgi:hypothetical protein
MIPLRILKVEEEYWDKEPNVEIFGHLVLEWVKKSRYTEKLQYLDYGIWTDVPTETRIKKCSDKNPDEEYLDRGIKQEHTIDKALKDIKIG